MTRRRGVTLDSMPGRPRDHAVMEPARAHASAFDALAPSFDRHRALPEGVAEAVRAAVLDADRRRAPRLLDLGAGTGRIGWPFVAAGDDYVGVDLSLGMLRAFAQRLRCAAPRLVQADGHRLPFRRRDIRCRAADPGVRRDRRLAALRRRGAARAAAVRRGAHRPHGRARRRRRRAHEAAARRHCSARSARSRAARTRREDVEHLLGASAADTRAPHRRRHGRAERTPRQFLERHRGGARFSALPDSVKDDALARLADWAEQAFGSLDAVSPESHAFELRVFKFEGAVA